MPGIYHVYVDVLHDIHGIYMVYTWIYHVYLSDWIYMVYPWIYHVYPPTWSIYMVYPWIYMVYHLMYIHGIYVVYCGISMDIPSFLKPDFVAGQCCWSHSMHTRVWVIKSVLFHKPPWQVLQGKRLPIKGSTRLQFPACRWSTRWWQRWQQRRRQVSLKSFCFSLQATTWALVKYGAEGAFRAGDLCVEQLRWLPVLKIKKKINFYLQGGGTCSSDEPKRFDGMFVAIILNSELSLSSDQKSANTWQYKVTIRTVSYWYLVETHSIPDQNEVKNLTDLNVGATQ
jgi:hypothetical protein